MHFAICTCRTLVTCNHGYKNWRLFWRKKPGVNEIYSWSRGFLFRQKFMIEYKSSMIASRDICIYFGKKTWSHLRRWFYLYKKFTRHINVECFEWAVPASFLSYAPTFFGSNKYFLQNVCWKIFMYTYPWTQTECAHLNILNLLQTKCRWKLPYYRRTIFRQAPSSSHISGMKKNVWKSACGFSIPRLEDTSNFNGVSFSRLFIENIASVLFCFQLLPEDTWTFYKIKLNVHEGILVTLTIFKVSNPMFCYCRQNEIKLTLSNVHTIIFNIILRVAYYGIWIGPRSSLSHHRFRVDEAMSRWCYDDDEMRW